MKIKMNFKVWMAAAMLLGCSTTFVACGGDDDGETPTPPAENVTVPTEAGWSGDVDNGTSVYVPETASAEDGTTVYCSFKATGGKCTQAQACMKFDSEKAANEYYQYLLEDDDEEEDYDDDDDPYKSSYKAPVRRIGVGTHAQAAFSKVMAKARKAARKAAKAQSRVSAGEIGIYHNGKIIYFDLPVVGQTMSDVAAILKFWESIEQGNSSMYYSPLAGDLERGQDDTDVAKLPSKPLFGTISSDLDYSCTLYKQSIYYYGAGLVSVSCKVERNANNQIVGWTATDTFASEQAARYYASDDDPDDEIKMTVDGKKVIEQEVFPTEDISYLYSICSAQEVETMMRQYFIAMDLMFNEPIGWALFYDR